jgi:hypothetical protein
MIDPLKEEKLVPGPGSYNPSTLNKEVRLGNSIHEPWRGNNFQ